MRTDEHEIEAANPVRRYNGHSEKVDELGSAISQTEIQLIL